MKIETEVRKIYEFYIDVFAARSMLLQITVFLWVICLMGKKTAWYRLILASAMETLLQLLCIWNSIWKMFPVILLVQLLVFSKILCTTKDKRKIFRSFIYYMTLVSVHISMLKMAIQLSREYLYFCEAGITLGMMLFIVLMKQERGEKKEIYHTIISAFGEKVEVNALLDTGNELREKATGKPVCIVEKECIEEILKHVSWEDYHFISFHSVGQEQGILAAIEADQIAVTGEENTKKIYGAIIGIYTGKLSSEGRFQMILHKDCLKGRMGYGNNVEHLFAPIYENRGA